MKNLLGNHYVWRLTIVHPDETQSTLEFEQPTGLIAALGAQILVKHVPGTVLIVRSPDGWVNAIGVGVIRGAEVGP